MLGAITSLAGDLFSAAGGISSAVGGLGGWFETPYQAHFQRKATDHANFLNQQNQYLNLVHGPSLQMEGLRKAGINPLLPFAHGVQTLPSIAGASALSLAKPDLKVNPVDSYYSTSAKRLALDSAREDVKSKELQNEILKEQARVAKGKYDYEERKNQNKLWVEAARELALHGKPIVDIFGPYIPNESPLWLTLVDNFRNEIMRENYQSSRGHKIFEDALETVRSLPKIQVNSFKRNPKYNKTSIKSIKRKGKR